MAGDQLTHSAFLQSLAALAMGLFLDQLLCRQPRPPHHSGTGPDQDGAPGSFCPSEWNWLFTYSTTVKSAEAFARGTAFPESFIAPEFHHSGSTELTKPLVRCKGVNPCEILEGTIFVHLFLFLSKSVYNVSEGFSHKKQFMTFFDSCFDTWNIK